METIVIMDNNPNLLPGIFIIVCISVIITMLIGIKLQINRRNRLMEVRKKIINRHEIMMEEQERRERRRNANHIKNVKK